MTVASNAILVDTNILVYPYDPRDTAKQQLAAGVLDRLVRSERIVLSAQCLTEFFVVTTQRLPMPLSTDSALTRIWSLGRTCLVFDVSLMVVTEACRAVARYQLQFWDALIWAVAKLHQVPYILTEDVAHGRSIEDVIYLNPFDPSFDLQRIVSGR